MIGHIIIELNSVDSTNLYLNSLLKSKELPEGTLVFTKEQTSGRGQLNNKWESHFDKNLLVSFVIYPGFLMAENQFMLSKMVALGVSDFLLNHLENVKIKWPNDIYIGQKKIAGILIENSLRGANITNSIIGIGININQVEFSKELPNPTSLNQELGKSFDLKKLLVLLCEKLNERYKQLKSGEDELVNSLYIKRLYKFGMQGKYMDKKGAFYATIDGVDSIGRLCLLDLEGQLRKYSFKEVEFIH